MSIISDFINTILSVCKFFNKDKKLTPTQEKALRRSTKGDDNLFAALILDTKLCQKHIKEFTSPYHDRYSNNAQNVVSKTQIGREYLKSGLTDELQVGLGKMKSFLFNTRKGSVILQDIRTIPPEDTEIVELYARLIDGVVENNDEYSLSTINLLKNFDSKTLLDFNENIAPKVAFDHIIFFPAGLDSKYDFLGVVCDSNYKSVGSNHENFISIPYIHGRIEAYNIKIDIHKVEHARLTEFGADLMKLLKKAVRFLIGIRSMKKSCLRA
jgi:hypothetical protein